MAENEHLLRYLQGFGQALSFPAVELPFTLSRRSQIRGRVQVRLSGVALTESLSQEEQLRFS